MNYTVTDLFHKFAAFIANLAGSSWAFLGAIFVIIVWLLTGFLFNLSDTWQLVINTITSIVTFLMVFLIQNFQNRDSKIIHLKLDELLKGVKGARTGLVDIEELSDEDLEKLHQEFRSLHEKYADELKRRGKKI